PRLFAGTSICRTGMTASRKRSLPAGSVRPRAAAVVSARLLRAVARDNVAASDSSLCNARERSGRLKFAVGMGAMFDGLNLRIEILLHRLALYSREPPVEQLSFEPPDPFPLKSAVELNKRQL